MSMKRAKEVALVRKQKESLLLQVKKARGGHGAQNEATEVM